MTDIGATREAQPARGFAWHVRPFADLALEIEAERERWFLWLPVCYGLGIGVYLAMFREPPLAALAPLALAAVVAHVLARRMHLAQLATGALLAMALGLLGAKLRSDFMAAPLLDRQLSAVDITGYVELVEPRPKRGQRVTLIVTSLGRLGEGERPHRVRVRTLTEDATLKPGDAIRLRATIGPPPSPAAPGDFDFGRLAWFSALGGIGLAIGRIEHVDDLPPAPLWLSIRGPVERLRQAIRARIVAALPGETGEIATALMTGERGGITDATNQAYRDSGLFHILSISGLH